MELRNFLNKARFVVMAVFIALMLILPQLPAQHAQAAGETTTFDISAIDVVIAINRFGDNNPQGKMFVLDENLAAVRAQEDIPLGNPDRVKIGLRDDPIQPLVIRANVGDTVVVNFTNQLDSSSERASFHIQGLPVDVTTSTGSNVGLNPDTTVGRGETIAYTIKIPDQTNYEGAYVFNSMGDPRNQQVHGLFGVLNVEPRGSTYLNPITGQPQKSGWDAIIVDPSGKDFREDTIIYHEFGDETFSLRDKNGNQLPLNPQMDGSTNYRPGSRLLNYRSEEFFRRDELVATVLQIPIGGQIVNQADESQDYGSYMNGDPPTPMPRGYVGDPTKRRIVNAGSERFHMEHLHGGSDRWPLDPFVEPDFWGLPFDKTATEQSVSTRLDSQGVGPGEAYTIQPEGAAGGLQAIAGEFLFHCHFGHHYIGGMWSFWRVFDTLQTADNGLFGNPALVELPDRAGLTPAPVNSVGLLGRTLTFADGTSGRTLTLGATSDTTLNIDEWVRSILPPQGVPGPYDSSVWDWNVNATPQGPLYLSEPETTQEWENYTSPAPGQRLEIKFNPRNGRLAFPLLRPHLGKRPPFSPGRSGAPYAGDTTDRDGSAVVDREHPDAMIPAAARRIEYTVVTILTPVTFNQGLGITQNPTGALLVLDEDKADILAGVKPKEQLTLRARVGDGVDVILYSEANDGAAFETSKANIHIHFVQFDTQASDGVISGLSYEQSVRSYQQEGPNGNGIRLTANAPAGSTNVTVDNASTLQVNAFVGIGFGVTRRNGDGGNLAGTLNSNGGFEYSRITAKNGNTLTLDRPLLNNHTTGQFVGVEFVRYQWYSDAESGTTFYHNHVNGIPGFGIALTGALIQEPVDARWTNPATDAEVRSGSQVVIHSPTAPAIGVPVQDFREQVLHFMGSSFNIPGGAGGESGAINMRQQPLDQQGVPSTVFSSVTHGDPETPVLNAYVGDLVGFRIMNSSGHDEVSFKVAGHRFRLERNDPREEPKDALQVGISERFDIGMIAGSVGLQAGDYLFTNGMHEKMMDGAWGLLRVSDTLQPNLLPLTNVPPSHPPLRPPGADTFPRNTLGTRGQVGQAPPTASEPVDVAGLKVKLERNGYSLMNGLPVDQIPVRTYDVVAIEKNIEFAPGSILQNGRVYVLAEDEEDIVFNRKPLEPLVIRANIGEIVKINFTNRLPAQHASFSVPQLIKTADSQGAALGRNNDSTVPPNGTYTYWYVIDPRFEIPRSFVITDYGDPIDGAHSGLYGQFIIEPSGAVYHDPVTGAEVKSGTSVKVESSSGNFSAFREVSLLFHDDDHGMNRDVMPYQADVNGITGINYKAVPFAERLAANADISKVFSSAVHGDPRTPLITVTAGEDVRLHIAGAFGQQPHVFSVDGHRFPFDSNRAEFMNLASRQFAPGVTIDTLLEGGAGGVLNLPGDYLYRDNRNPFLEAGLWGILRVLPMAAPTAPAGLAAPTVASNQVVLTWVDSINETRYRVERATGAGAFAVIAPSLGANTISFSDATVQPSTTYHYRVLAVNGVGASAPSNVIMVTTPATVSSGGGGGGGAVSPSPSATIELNGFSSSAALNVNSSGMVTAAARLEDSTGTTTIDIAAGTFMKAGDGSVLASISISPPATIPDAPPDQAVVVAHEFGPSGATFSPAITITLKFDPAKLPQGADKADLVIAFWNGTEWVAHESTVDASGNTVSAKTPHFTTFAILSPKTAPATVALPAAGAPPAATTTPPPAATPPAAVTTAPPPAAGTPPAATTTPPATTPAQSEPVAASQTQTWILIMGLVIAAFLVISLIAVLVAQRRTK